MVLSIAWCVCWESGNAGLTTTDDAGFDHLVKRESLPDLSVVKIHAP